MLHLEASVCHRRCSVPFRSVPKCDIPKGLYDELILLKEIFQAASFSLPQGKLFPTQVVWTDASTEAVAFFDEQSGRTWIHTLPAFVHNMPQLMASWEMTAVWLASQNAVQAPSWTVVTDNAAVERALSRGHSGNAYMDKLLREMVQSNRAPLGIRWVPSACQRVDPLTRAKTRHLGIANRCSHQHRTVPRSFDI
jgi:hypothetical protein